jgi:hypothetical protein
MFFHLFISSLVSFASVCSFSMQVSLVTFIPKYVLNILFDAVVSGVIS